MTTTVVRAAGPDDLLSYVEHTLGFRPRESLVLVSLRPPRWRVGMVARIDLADAHATRFPALARHLSADGAGRAVLFVVSEGPTPPLDTTGRAVLDGLPLAAAVRGLRAALAAQGVPDAEAWLVRGGRAWSYTCAEPCCPGRGRAIGDLSGTRVAAEMVLAGSAVADDRAAWTRRETAALAPASAAVRRAAESAARRVAPEQDGASVLAWWREVLADASRAVAAGRPPADVAEELLSPTSAGRMLGALAATPWRDAVLLTLVPGGDAVADLVAAGTPGVAELVDGVLDGDARGDARGDDDSGDHGADHDEAADALLRFVVRCAGASRRAQPLAVLAWSAWHRGAGARAGLCAELALRSSPDHALAGLVLAAVSGGVRAQRPGAAALHRTGEEPPATGQRASAW